MFPYPILSDNSEAQHSSISIYIPSAGRSFMLEFLGWSFKYHLVWCFPNCFGLFGHLLFGFRFPGEIVICWPEGNQRKRWWAWIMIPICWMLLVSWWIFSNNRRRLFRSRPLDRFRTFQGSFDRSGRFCLHLCLCIILTRNPIDYLFSSCIWESTRGFTV